MPLYTISAKQAAKNLEGNRAGFWGDRATTNRLEPVAKPTFQAPFQFTEDDAIFTIGSCFARNIEVELQKRGFHLPMRQLLALPEFATVPPMILNNYGPASIYNELRWSLEPSSYDEDAQVYKLEDGRYMGLHYRLEPSEKKDLLTRLGMIRKAYASIVNCRIVIITLGLIEVWFDTETQTYLNLRPNNALKECPDRFELHVMSFAETLRYVSDAIALLKQYGRDDMEIILTVSPVPILATFQERDVMVANTYSKSVLRTVAEEVCAVHERITYFPSYESVVLSDRKIAWEDDLIHPTSDIVALNVGRMLDAYIKTDTPYDEIVRVAEAGGALIAAEQIDKVAALGPEHLDKFLARFSSYSITSPSFAIRHAELAAGKNPQLALNILKGIPLSEQTDHVKIEIIKLQITVGSSVEAAEQLKGMLRDNNDAIWDLYLTARLAIGEPVAIADLLARWLRVSPKGGRLGIRRAARHFQKAGDVNAASLYFWSVGLLSPLESIKSEATSYLESQKDFQRVSEVKEDIPLIMRNATRKRVIQAIRSYIKELSDFESVSDS